MGMEAGIILKQRIAGSRRASEMVTKNLQGDDNADGQRALPCIGWREWVSLPQLDIKRVKAKVDTGARTSTLHAFAVETFRAGGRQRVRFSLHPIQRNVDKVVECTADVHDIRWVSDSGGHREKRVVILTEVCLGGYCWPIELTLTNRDSMQFRMLLGRTAMNGRFVVDPEKSYLIGKLHKKRKGGK